MEIYNPKSSSSKEYSMSYATLTENVLQTHDATIQNDSDSDDCVYDANLELAESVISGAMDLPEKVSVASSIDAHGPAALATTR